MKEIADKIAPYIHQTPVLTSDSLNSLFGCHVFFKCENFQKTGSFKIRGASHAILSLSPEQRSKGVVTHSSGNFAQALAKAASLLGIEAYIVMPDNAPMVKVDAVHDFGATIIRCKPTIKAREEAAKKLEAETGATFVHPSNQLTVIQGQGTSAYELLEEYPEIKVIFVPVGGGGLIGGTVLAAKRKNVQIRVFGGEPKAADDAYRSLQSGKIESNITTDTIADGLRTQLGEYNFPIILNHVEEIYTVSEVEIVAAMKLIWERLKIVIEPSSAAAVAALWQQKSNFNGQNVGIILSGGNVDLEKLPF